MIKTQLTTAIILGTLICYAGIETATSIRNNHPKQSKTSAIAQQPTPNKVHVSVLADMDSTLKRTETMKYVEVSRISLKFEDPEKDYQEFSINEGSDLEKSMEEAELKRFKRDLKNSQKALEAGEYVPSSKDKQSIEIDNTVFTDDANLALKKNGFIDTTSTIYPDNVNTLFLEGNIRRIHEFSVKRAGTGSRDPYFFIFKLEMMWYIKNIYDETIDSMSIESVTDRFVCTYAYPSISRDQTINTIQSGVNSSMEKVLKSQEFDKYTTLQTNFDVAAEQLKISGLTSSVLKKEDAVPASVTIKTKSGHGSGFAISNDGYILTNFHVIAGAKQDSFPEIKVINYKGEETVATVVRVNRNVDVALLKVDMKFEKAFKITNTKNYKNLESVYTIGTPKSTELGQSISSGIVSNERQHKNLDLIQMAMPVNSGNSGGPLFDTDGELHGVIVAKLFGWGTEGISFAVPSYKLSEYLHINY